MKTNYNLILFKKENYKIPQKIRTQNFFCLIIITFYIQEKKKDSRIESKWIKKKRGKGIKIT
jgi:thioredoxin-related protein